MTLELEKVQPKHWSTGVQIQSTNKQNIYSRWLNSVISSPSWWHWGQWRTAWLTWKGLTLLPRGEVCALAAGTHLTAWQQPEPKAGEAVNLLPSDPKIKGWCPPVPAECIFSWHSLFANTFFFKVSFHFEAQLLILVGQLGFKQRLEGSWGCPHWQQGVHSLPCGLNKCRHGTCSYFRDKTAHVKRQHREEATWQVVVKCCLPLHSSTKALAQKWSNIEAAAGKSEFGPWYLQQPCSPKQKKINCNRLTFMSLWVIERPP